MEAVRLWTKMGVFRRLCETSGKPKGPSRRRIFEEADALVKGSVDSRDKVIRGVKIVGLESRNTARVLGLDERDFGSAVDKPYRYSESALREAAQLYEGASVYSGHLPFSVEESGQRVFKSSSRPNDDLVGWLENVRYVEGQGLYGDLHVIESHPLAQSLFEVAQRRPDKYALSHEANFGDPTVENGRVVIGRIESVNAVALINDRPGTTNGLFESAEPADPFEEPGSMSRAMLCRRRF